MIKDTVVYATLSYQLSWTGKELGLTPQSTQEEINEAIDKAIEAYLNTGAIAVDPPDTIETECCGFKNSI